MTRPLLPERYAGDRSFLKACDRVIALATNGGFSGVSRRLISRTVASSLFAAILIAFGRVCALCNSRFAAQMRAKPQLNEASR